MRLPAFLLAGLLGLVGGGFGLRLYPAPSRPNSLTVAGSSNDLAQGTAWGVTMCPATGGVVSALAFIAHSSSQDGLLSYATLIVENHTTGETMCALQVPCTIEVGDSATTTCDAGVRCQGGDVVHVEWANNLPDGGLMAGCTGSLPAGAGGGVILEQ